MNICAEGQEHVVHTCDYTHGCAHTNPIHATQNLCFQISEKYLIQSTERPEIKTRQHYFFIHVLDKRFTKTAIRFKVAQGQSLI